MNLLKIDHSKKLVISPEALAIPEFSAIWKRDRSVKKENAINELSYIYYLIDYASIYLAYPADVRDKQIRKDLNIKKLSKDLKAGISKYRELQKTPSMRFLTSARDALEAMTKYFEMIDFEERTVNGAPVYKATDVTRCLKDCGGIQDSLDKLKEKVKNELYEKGSTKGGGEVNPFEE